MKVRMIAKRATELSRRLTAAYEPPLDWRPSYIEGGYDDEFWDEGRGMHWDELDEACPHGYLYSSHCEDCDAEDVDVDTCTGCGRAYGAHAGLSAWDRDREGGIAPQLCHRCWQDAGYSWPEIATA